MAEERNQYQGPRGTRLDEEMDTSKKQFQGGGRTGTPVKPQARPVTPTDETPGAHPVEKPRSDREPRQATDWDANRGQSGRTAAGEDTRPL